MWIYRAIYRDIDNNENVRTRDRESDLEGEYREGERAQENGRYIYIYI